jgi:hypothetical protein
MPKRADKKASSPAPRADVQAMLALVALDEGIAKHEAAVAKALALAKQAEAGAASAELRDACADLAARRGAITGQIPQEALEDYERALRRRLMPAAVATRGRVCWGCFHGLSAAVAAEFRNTEAFLRCPHCERVLFNPDWSERP